MPGPGKAVDLLLWTIWLVTDAFMLLTVHGIISLSLIRFPLQLYVTAGKNVGYSSLTFVLFQTSKSFIIFAKFAIPAFLCLYIVVGDIGDEKC